VFPVRRQVGQVVAAVVTAVVVAGCGSGPSQLRSAVIVGSTSVPLSQVQSRVDTALGKTDLVARLAGNGVGPPDIARDVVTRSVLHDLLARTAAAEGIVVSEADVDATLQENGGADATLQQTLYDLPALRERIRDRIIAARHAQRVVPGLAVTADVVGATSEEDAAAKARVLAAGGPAAEQLFAQSGGASGRGVTYAAAERPEVASTVLFGLQPGRTAYFQPSPEGGWVVLRVTDRREDPNADPSVAAALGQDDLARIGERLLQPVAEQVGVRVNPRFGVWDPITLRVVPEGKAGGAVLPPGAA
jgi:hypothetical protein